MKAKQLSILLLSAFFLLGCGGGESSSLKVESSSFDESSSVIETTIEIENTTETTELLSSEVSLSSEQASSSSIESDASIESSIYSTQSDEETTSSISYIAVTSVSLNKTSIDLDEGDTFSLVATVLPFEATDKSLTWTSGDEEVASIDNGTVTAINEGTAIITAKTNDGNKTASATVNVHKKIVIPDYVLYGRFSGDSSWVSLDMETNAPSTSEWMIRGVRLSEDDLFKVHMHGDTWYGYSDIKSSVDSSFFTQGGSDNNIKVLVSGIYDIYSDANYSDGGHLYLGKVGEIDPPVVVHVNDVTLNQTSLTMEIGDTYTLEASVFPEDASNKNVTWSTSDPRVASVSNGLVTALSSGETLITVETEDGAFIETCRVTVTPDEPIVIPDYYLAGKINGVWTGTGNYSYAALPRGDGTYIISDVTFLDGDLVYVYDSQKRVLKNDQGIRYQVGFGSDMIADVYLDPNDENMNYLRFVKKSRDIYVRYPSWMNDDQRCAYIWVWGEGFDSKWIKSNDLEASSTSSKFTIPKTSTGFKVVQADANATIGDTYDSIGTIYNETLDIPLFDNISIYQVTF